MTSDTGTIGAIDAEQSTIGLTDLQTQIERLLASVAEHGSHHLAEIASDLAQTDMLIREAIEKLNASFMAVHEAARAQQEAVTQLLGGASDDASHRLAEAGARIERGVNAAVTGLQFQDMTSQLLARALLHTDGLRAVLDGLGARSRRLADGDAAALAGTIAGLNEGMERDNTLLDRKVGKSVRQTHMESGDVELF